MLASAVLQLGIPEVLPGVVGIAATVVLALMVTAIAAFVYKSLTGGVEWPADREEDDDALRRGDQDDEWDYY